VPLVNGSAVTSLSPKKLPTSRASAQVSRGKARGLAPERLNDFTRRRPRLPATRQHVSKADSRPGRCMAIRKNRRSKPKTPLESARVENEAVRLMITNALFSESRQVTDNADGNRIYRDQSRLWDCCVQLPPESSGFYQMTSQAPERRPMTHRQRHLCHRVPMPLGDTSKKSRNEGGSHDVIDNK
jgi:hypothetical protein